VSKRLVRNQTAMKHTAFLLLLFAPSLHAEEAPPVPPAQQQQDARQQFVPNERVQGYRPDWDDPRGNDQQQADGNENKRTERQNEARRQMEQRQTEMEKSVREALAHNGVTAVAVQDAILQHVAGEARARGPLREHARRLLRVLQSAPPVNAEAKAGAVNPEVPQAADDQIEAMLNEYMMALQGDRARREAAEAALDERILWSENPRLHALLLLFGAIGDSPLTLPLRAFTETRPQRPGKKPERNDAPLAAPPAATPAYTN
jgi:hypothetical protein